MRQTEQEVRNSKDKSKKKLKDEKNDPHLLHSYAKACLIHKIFVTRGKKLSGWWCLSLSLSLYSMLILRVVGAEALGTMMLKMPSLRLARTLSWSTREGKAKERENSPTERSETQ